MSSTVVRRYLKRGIRVFKAPSLVVVIAVLLIAVAPSAAQDCPGATQEGWDGGDLNLWHGLAGTVVLAPTTGGNPSGYLEADSVTAGLVSFGNQNPPWSGDWVAGEIREILIDVNVLGGDGITGPSFRIRKGPASNGWYYFNSGVITNDGQWHSFTAPISPDWSDAQAVAAGWLTYDDPIIPFSETLAAMGILSFLVSSVPANHPVGFDNAEISCGIFADGFESGSTNAWATVVGLSG